MNKQTSAHRRHIFDRLRRHPQCSNLPSSTPCYSSMGSLTSLQCDRTQGRARQTRTISAPPTTVPASEQGPTCPICLGNDEDVQITTCKHTFCKACYQIWFSENNSCPMCRAIDGASTAHLCPNEATIQRQGQHPINRNALLNQALIDNFRIQHGNYSSQTKAQSRQLLKQMNVQSARNVYGRQPRGATGAHTQSYESSLRELQHAISLLLQSRRDNTTNESLPT
jgi:hypothetical protein